MSENNWRENSDGTFVTPAGTIVTPQKPSLSEKIVDNPAQKDETKAAEEANKKLQIQANIMERLREVTK